MREALEELLIVLAYSAKTQVAILFGLVFFVVTMSIGHYFSTHLEMHGVLAPLTEMVRDNISRRYDKAAWGTLLALLLLAAKSYKKDRKRLLQL